MVCTTCGLKIWKNPPEAAKVVTSVKFFNVGKNNACYPHQDFEIQFFSTLFNTYVYRRVSFTAVVIIISQEQEIFGSKILMMETTISFLSECLAVWRLSRNQFKPVWAETVKNYPARKLTLLSPQNRYIGHQRGIWKIMGKAIFFVKESSLIKVLVKSLEAVEAGTKIAVFQIHVSYFLFWQNLIFWKIL